MQFQGNGDGRGKGDDSITHIHVIRGIEEEYDSGNKHYAGAAQQQTEHASEQEGGITIVYEDEPDYYIMPGNSTTH